MNANVLNERTAIALAAIKSLFGKPEGEYGPTLFVSHHFRILSGEYWLKAVGVKQPNADQVLDSLILRGSWISEGGKTTNTFDFCLPENASNYVLSVRFQDNGQVNDVSMES